MNEISVITPINDLGYGIVGSNLTITLDKLGVKVNLFPIGEVRASQGDFDRYFSKFIDNAKNNYAPSAPCIRIWHQFDMSMFVGYGTHIGFPIFELNKFTEQEKHQLSCCNVLFVCSSWAKRIMRENLGDKCPPIHVVNLGVDNNLFTPKKSFRNSTVFLNVGKWEVRKGHDVLHKLFNQAFNINDNVELWIMFDNPFLTQEQMLSLKREYSDTKLGNKIRFIPRLSSQKQVANVMQQSDCGVFPSRAEGWNLELLEMMACGKHCIATHYSAHTDMSDGFIGIPISEFEPAYGRKNIDDRWFKGQGDWAKLDETYIGNFVDAMREIHRKKQNGELDICQEAVILSNRLSWENSAKSIIESGADE